MTTTQRITIKNSDPKVRLAAVEKMTDDETALDETALKEIVLTDSDRKVRMVAVAGITDKAFLKKLILEDLDSEVRVAGIARIRDKEILEEIILETSYQETREKARKMITIIDDFAITLAKMAYQRYYSGNFSNTGCGEGSCRECDNYGCNLHPYN